MENDLQPLPKVVQRNKWTMGNKIGAPIGQGLDVPNCVKDIPNFVKNVPNFVNDVPRLSKYVPRWRTTSNHFSRVFK